jgi:hypothetical protein
VATVHLLKVVALTPEVVAAMGIMVEGLTLRTLAVVVVQVTHIQL